MVPLSKYIPKMLRLSNKLTATIDDIIAEISGKKALYVKSQAYICPMIEQARRLERELMSSDYCDIKPAPITGSLDVSQMKQIIANMNITGLKSLQAILNQVIADKDRKGATSIPKITESIDDGEIKDTFFGSLYNGLQIVDESDLLRW